MGILVKRYVFPHLTKNGNKTSDTVTETENAFCPSRIKKRDTVQSLRKLAHTLDNYTLMQYFNTT